MNSFEVQEYFKSFSHFERHLSQKTIQDFTLKNIKLLLSLLGDPQEDLRIIHVAGSKGKGSVCAFTASMLKEAGYKVGLYTSPHLDNVRERMRIVGRKKNSKEQRTAHANQRGDVFDDQISEEDFCALIEVIKKRADQLDSLTYFEFLTAAALYYFKQEKVDCVVLETGLGGRLDATNAVDSMVSVVTSISLEHQKILGQSLKSIAREKAAIIKNKNQKVVVAWQEEEALAVISARCKDMGVSPWIMGNQIKIFLKENDTFDVKFPHEIKKDLKISLLGDHQIENASVALGIIMKLKELGWGVSDASIYKGLSNVSFPGRFEIIEKELIFVLDGAHNPYSANQFAKTYFKRFKDKKADFILGFSDDKNVLGIMNCFKPMAQTITFVKSKHPRSAKIEKGQFDKELKDVPVYYEEGIEKAIRDILEKKSKKDIVCITGSLYLVAEARALVQGL